MARKTPLTEKQIDNRIEWWMSYQYPLSDNQYSSREEWERRRDEEVPKLIEQKQKLWEAEYEREEEFSTTG